MKATDVFTPTSVPTVTYIEREEQNLEKQLENSLKTPGLIISLSGPSKSGKTVLINKIIPQENLIAVSGAAIRTAEMLWERVLNWMEAPSETSSTSSHTVSADVSGKMSGKADILIASADVEGATGAGYAYERTKEKTFARNGIDQVVREIANSDFVLFLDDFHYMNKETQNDVAKQIKEAAEKNVRICTASVPHRSDDVVRGNPELRGRVRAIDFSYWKNEETFEIAKRGFSSLNIVLADEILRRFASEAFGSPQLMQQICLQTCFYLDVDKTLDGNKDFALSEQDIGKILEQTSTATDFSSLLAALHSGPKQRGSTRTPHKLNDGSVGDVYRCILLALSEGEPRLSFNYDEIYQRTRRVCVADPPSGSSVAQALGQFPQICESIQPGIPVIEWDEDVLDIVDPYFLYYLRCSSKMSSLKKTTTTATDLPA